MDEFYKLFDDNWQVFSHMLKELETKGLFMISDLEQRPGSFKYELTKRGHLKLSELLNERSNAISLNPIQPETKKDPPKVQSPGFFRRIAGFFALIPNKFKMKRSGNVELTIPGRGDGMETY